MKIVLLFILALIVSQGLIIYGKYMAAKEISYICDKTNLVRINDAIYVCAREDLGGRLL